MRPLLEVDNLVTHFPIRTGFFRKTTGWVQAETLRPPALTVQTRQPPWWRSP